MHEYASVRVRVVAPGADDDDACARQRSHEVICFICNRERANALAYVWYMYAALAVYTLETDTVIYLSHPAIFMPSAAATAAAAKNGWVALCVCLHH